MGALEAVLQYKAQEAANQKAQGDSILQAVQLFQQARQQATENKLKELTLNATLQQNALENSRKSSEDESQRILRDAQTKQLLASADFLQKNMGGQGTQLSPELLQQAGIPSEDIQMTPQTFSYKGVQKTKLVPELKKEVSQAQATDLGGIDSTISDLNKNVETLNKYKIQSGPGFSTSGLPGADIYSQFTKSPEFNAWKADTGRAFQKYRKWATGVAAGYPELRLLVPNFPKASDTHDVYVAKAESVINDMNRNKEILLDYLSKSGYRTGNLRNNTAIQKEDKPPISREAAIAELKRRGKL